MILTRAVIRIWRGLIRKSGRTLASSRSSGQFNSLVDALTIPSQGISQIGLAAVSAAFGLANGTVNTFNSLLLQVDHTTVQNVVFTSRHAFREDVLKLSSAIDNKPAAIHTLPKLPVDLHADDDFGEHQLDCDGVSTNRVCGGDRSHCPVARCAVQGSRSGGTTDEAANSRSS